MVGGVFVDVDYVLDLLMVLFVFDVRVVLRSPCGEC